MNRDSSQRVSRGRGYFPGRYRQAHRYNELTDASITSNEPKNEYIIQESVEGLSESEDHKPACSVEPPTNMIIPNIMESKQGEYFLISHFPKRSSREVASKRHARYGPAGRTASSIRRTD